MIKILVVDDSEILIKSLKIILEQDPELQITGFAKNGAEALDLAGQLTPDIILMDVRMPVCNGVEGTKLIKQKHGSIKILMLTTFDDQQYIEEAILNGADGYILKDINDEDLIAAVKSVAKGFSIIHGCVFQALKKQIKSSSGEKHGEPQNPDYNLTDREREITGLIVDGLSNKEIAATLEISEGTVRNIISGILAKLKLSDRTQLAVFAIKNNFID